MQAFQKLTVPPQFELTAADRHVDSFVIERASDIVPLELLWLWPQRIPAGRVTLLAGDPGIAKSLLAIDMAARVSRGAPWPDDPERSFRPDNVIFFSTEDNLRETIVPRLKQADADLSRVCIVEGVYNVPPFRKMEFKRRFSMPQDLRSLDMALRELYPVSLVVFDPITAYCGNGEASGPRVHAMMGPLTEIASRYGTTILCTTHLRKGSSAKSVHRMAGSLAFTTAARAVWAVVQDPEDSTRRIMSPVKLNLAPVKDALAFRLVDGRVEWEREPLPITADGAFEAERSGRKVAAATAWLRNALSQGEQAARWMLQQASECGISPTTLHRAREKLSVRLRKEGIGSTSRWFWSLDGT